MKLENNKNYLDEKVWRCRSKINVHDEKKTCSMKGITKVYSLIRTKIRTKMHTIWNYWSLNKGK